MFKPDGDVMVLKTQEYLNTTYSWNPNWVRIEPNGKTGWPTIKGLIRALQIETGISTPNGTFGPATEAACPTLKKDLNPTNKTERLVFILQGAMWCKGFSPGGFTGTFGDKTESGVKKFQSSAGLEGTKVNGIANPMIFKALLNMDAYVLVSSGDSKIREIQMCLNRDYYKWIGLRPTDGRYGRDTNKALIYAIQVEEGIAEPNGTFGPQTQSLLPTLAPGSKNTPFVKIMQYALYCNRFDPTGFTGVFGNGTLAALKKFQAFCMLTADGYCGKQAWCSLMVSCGDKDRKGTACDCSSEVTDSRAKTLKTNGYKIVGRYIVGGAWKKLKKSEAQVIFKNGLKLFPIFQKSGNSIDYFTEEQGRKDGEEAVRAALDYGFPKGSTIYFAVDFDAVNDQVTSTILPYFRKIQQSMFLYNPRKYKIGIYGARNVCSRVSKKGIATTSFVSDMSTGFSGNLGYPLPENWAFDQIKEYTIGSGDGAIAIDNNIASGRDEGVEYLDGIIIPPSFTEGYILEYASNKGLFEGAGILYERFNKKRILAVPSVVPLITVEGELSLVETLIGPHNTVNFQQGSDTYTASFVNSATNSGVDLDIGKDAKKSLDLSLAKLRISQSLGTVKYFAEFTGDGNVSVVLETALPCKSLTNNDVLTIYQRVYITIHKDKFQGFNNITIPIATEDSYEISPEASGWVSSIVTGALVAGAIAGMGLIIHAGMVGTVAGGLKVVTGLFIAAVATKND